VHFAKIVAEKAKARDYEVTLCNPSEVPHGVIHFWEHRSDALRRRYGGRTDVRIDIVSAKVAFQGGTMLTEGEGATTAQNAQSLPEDGSNSAVQTLQTLNQEWEKLSEAGPNSRFVTVAQVWSRNGKLIDSEVFGCSCRSTIWAGVHRFPFDNMHTVNETDIDVHVFASMLLGLPCRHLMASRRVQVPKVVPTTHADFIVALTASRWRWYCDERNSVISHDN